MSLEDTAKIKPTFDRAVEPGGRAPISVAFEAAHDNIDPNIVQLKQDAKAGNVQSFGPNTGLAAGVFPVLAAATPVQDNTTPATPKPDNTPKLTS